MSTDFALDPRLAADAAHVGDLALCRVLLMDDSRFPWLILAPRRAGASEITDLSDEDSATLMEEMRIAVGVMLALAKPDKVNVAALGNAVPQLHVHVIGRFLSDPAWPRPVWGVGERQPYPAHARAQMIERVAALFAAALSMALGYATSRLRRHSSEAAAEPPALDAAGARVVAIAGDTIVLARAEPWTALLPPDRAPAGAITIFLGELDGAPVFAVSAPAEAAPAEGDPNLRAVDLRSLAAEGSVDEHELGLLATAKSILSWHRRNGFCAQCGAATALAAGGFRRDCAACGTHHFPRVDPVVIMLVTRGDSCLLGRAPRFPPAMYSCLAGFLEPGETIEAAVRRETLEEAGIRVGAVSYHASQPWPFPSSLMIGCVAQALDEAVTIDPAELDDARWLSRREVALMLERRHPKGLTAPPPMAIAHALMRAFVDGLA